MFISEIRENTLDLVQIDIFKDSFSVVYSRTLLQDIVNYSVHRIIDGRLANGKPWQLDLTRVTLPVTAGGVVRADKLTTWTEAGLSGHILNPDPGHFKEASLAAIEATVTMPC